MGKKIKRFVKNASALLKRKKIIPVVVEKTEGLLSGKRALIIGGDGGIGFAIAKEFVNSGCQVAITGRKPEKLERCKKECEELKTIVFTLDDFEKYESVIADASEVLGGKIDIVVNAAGVHTQYAGFNFLNVASEEYDRVMNVNLKSNYFLCQKAGKYFIQNKIKGHILLISSQTALFPSWSPYRLSKLGLEGLIEGAAQQLIEYGIVVNGIGPGQANTEMIDYHKGDSIYTDDNPIERMVTVEEIAQVAKLLVSEQGNSIVGQTIYMSGGKGIIDKGQ